MAIATTTALLLAATAISTGVALYGADTAAKQQESNLKFQAAQTAADAAAARGAAEVEAMRIRRAAKAQRAQATAAAAASGVDINSPTALKIDQEITANAEEDATLTILNGADRGARMDQQATFDQQGARAIKAEAKTQQAATLLSAVSSSYNATGGWKRA